MERSTHRILIVDDDERVRRAHVRLIQSLGYETEVAADGIEALAKLRLDIDLVLLDVEMPHIDGFEVARRIRAEPASRHVPIVMITGRTAREDHMRAIEAGVNDFVSKPVDPTELELRMRWHLELKTAHDALKSEESVLARRVESRTTALRLALEEMTEARRATYEAHLDTIRKLTLAAEYKDKDTAGHIERIGMYSAVIARALGLPPQEVELIRYAAPMHDVGKLGIPDAVLLKPGSLSDEEWIVMRSHTAIGAHILQGSPSDLIQMGEKICLTHHEKWDGGGYPNGISGEDIALEGRICAVVDVFDALTMDRPYRDALEHATVYGMIEEDIGSHFDPLVAEAFMDHRDEIEAIQRAHTRRPAPGA